ncbi:Primase C terminal 2 (PriCT-2) [Mesorhizobium albiziae]|uniref:Primase C terminal 2 (PriCT-2) n=1 Tax=Neomesorhizobium albiziae TaxID=335020 RepID=A0A1I4DSD1_9HYPH|nr:DUF5906 domain-containing protein [Mesorhizobium albiziae]GLS33749.1 hypothetical protein GCM10007937_54610 [Mesorhizobium albiziae]SFK96295.1 Primase C terminal 2 (PriCT-2) [Mesorhizobium albiziae]
MADISATAAPVNVAQDFNQALAFVNAITGNQAETAILDFRSIHDANKAIPAIPFRDTLAGAWSSIVHYNAQGYGVFATIAEMDGQGRTLANVRSLRANYVDLDNLSAQQNLERAAQWYPAPSFAVQTSPTKYHCYWSVVAYSGNDRFELLQRKLRQFFDGDKAVIDATRVMRLPGTINSKYSNPESDKYNGSAPHLVSCFSLPGYGYVTPAETLEAALASVSVIDGGGGRYELGEPSLAAPSLDWLRFALKLLDPNDLDRGEWIGTSAAVKQAGWTLVTHEQELFDIWSEWCSRYDKNEPGENLKQWSSFRVTEVGWPSLQRRIPSLTAYQHLMVPPAQPTAAAASPPMPGTTQPATPPMPAPPELDCSGEMLTHMEQQQWFAGCVFITARKAIVDRRSVSYNAGTFNARFGGKKFIIDGQGKTTDEAWKAATRSTLWTIPKVDDDCFLPGVASGEISTDELGRTRINAYVPAKIDTMPGDPSPFLNHLAAMLPVESDRKILLDFMAHCVKFPGYKIPWAPLIQSTEGMGKNAFKYVMEHAIGDIYCYPPNAKELVESGSKFTGWMERKLFFVCDEIRSDERRNMVEVLKPMITERKLEIQGKGVDQKKGDNPGNWMFFSNFKNAIPVNRNGRRFAIFYSVIQSQSDLLARGMDKQYFDRLYGWLGDEQNGGHRTGLKIVAHYLLNHPIERGGIPMRAPTTSSTAEALIESRGPIGSAIAEAVAQDMPGFRGGWISRTAAKMLFPEKGYTPQSITDAIEELDYVKIGRATVPIFQENREKPELFNINPQANIADYRRTQGYE